MNFELLDKNEKHLEEKKIVIRGLEVLFPVLKINLEPLVKNEKHVVKGF